MRKPSPNTPPSPTRDPSPTSSSSVVANQIDVVAKQTHQSREEHIRLIEALTVDGYVIMPDVLSAESVASLTQLLESELPDDDALHRGGAIYGARNLLRDIPAVRALAKSASVRLLVEPVLGAKGFAVRGLFFDKTPSANWPVAWHQDRTIAVREKRDVPGFGPWTVKAGVPHVQPPLVILENMLTLRLHVDDCRGTNGPLQVIAG